MASVISFLLCAFLALQLARSKCPKDPPDKIESIPALTTIHDTYLKGYNIAILFVDNILKCYFECISPKYSNCTSLTFRYIPYDNGLHRCDLKNASKSTVEDTDMVTRPGYDYVDVISHFPAKATKPSKDCADLIKQGYKQDGVYTINPDGLGEFQVFCDQSTSDGGWIIFQRRLDGSVDFHRGWTDYQNGFGEVRGEYWLGLEKIHRLTRNGSYRLRVDLQDWAQNWTYAEYENFVVLGEQTNYTLSIGAYTGTAGDSLTDSHNDLPFTTKDRDNDARSDGNIARSSTGAWWFGFGYKSNLNGFYFNGSNFSNAGDNVMWGSWKGLHYSLKGAEMKIRAM